MPRVFFVAFDGLQPSQISAERMPVVSGLAASGVRFLHNHCAFPTVTRANSATIVSGVRPGKHGLTANKSVFPEYSNSEVVDALVPKLAEINRLTGGNLLFVPTIGEYIHESGLKWVSVVGGTSGNAYVQNPNAHEFEGVVIHPEFTNPETHHLLIKEQFGDWTAKEAPAADLVVRTADVAIDYALAVLDPDVLMVWFPEPDTAQHAFGIDSPEAQDMYSLADAQLGRILQAITHDGAPTDVFVVSDHGYSTIDAVIDVHTELAAGGFAQDDRRDGVVVAENGGSVLLYLPPSDPGYGSRLLEWLSDQQWVGGIATDLKGTRFSDLPSIRDVGLEGPRAPDIVVTMRSALTAQAPPLSRIGASTGGRVGAGSHGGGSPAELHNTLIVSGPSFRAGVESNLASGNIDIAPTVINLLNLPVSDQFEGRVLYEALRDGGGDSLDEKMSQQTTTSPTPGITITTVAATEYLCEFGY
ncbi:MAG: alkaline phosphatase family protein [Chloroflexi bacterium]|nr:alkaline phosphatase family protein [Chloroflexota bacterium]